MRKSTKIITTLVAMVLVISAISVGIWAAVSQTGGINTSISYQAVDVEFEWVAEVVSEAGTPAVADVTTPTVVLATAGTGTTGRFAPTGIAFNSTDHSAIVIRYFIRNRLSTDTLYISGISTGWDQTVANVTVTPIYKVSSAALTPLTLATATTAVAFATDPNSITASTSLNNVAVPAGRVFGLQITLTAGASVWADGLTADTLALPLTIKRTNS